MFGYSTGFAAYPTVYTGKAAKKSSKKATPPASVRSRTASCTDSVHSLEPSIDGPPSPERIRAYTEQMKRGSIFGGHSRSNTFSSATPSFISRESASPDSSSNSADNLSRKSSRRSNANSMPTGRSSRPESIQILGSLFSRSRRKDKKDSTINSTLGEDMSISSTTGAGEGSAKDHYYGRRGSRRRDHISGPYNFQHVTHTQQDHVQNLDQASHMELVSEFSALRASQAPTSGELRGIRADDLHFENFSSEALSTAPNEGSPAPSSPKSPRQRAVLRKPAAPAQLQRTMSYTKSHSDLRVPPPRPPRSPLTAVCPIPPPARTSSRTASVLYETFDPLATTTLERPYTQGGFRRPTPFSPPVPPPLPSWDEQQKPFSRPMLHAVSTPGDEAWPLPAAVMGNFGVELADVQEEDEDGGSRRSRLSTASMELRQSQSVPGLRRTSLEQSHERPDSRTSTTLGSSFKNPLSPENQELSSGFQAANDSWESDIDWCYEHEVEANCDFQWDHDPGEQERAQSAQSAPLPVLDLKLQDEERVYTGRFRPSLLVPSPYEMPDLSPISNSTISSDPQTPASFLRPQHVRSPSHASSFKESHGFDLSPTLLIPNDFQSQIEQEALYDEHFTNNPSRASIFVQEPYNHSISPVDEGSSSTASYRSSNFSRGSARSSSSTRLSGNSRVSQDSMILLERASGMSDYHRSIESASSVPDLIPSALQKVDIDLSCGFTAMTISDENTDSAPAPEIRGPATSLSSVQHRRNRSLILEQGLRKSVAPQKAVQESGEYDWALSPVAEFCPKFEISQIENGQAHLHGRKVSAPTMSQMPPVVVKGRPRASTSTGAVAGGVKKGKAGSYNLFPSVPSI